MRYTLVILLAAFPLFSHHAMEFIDLDSYTTAVRGEILFHLHYDYFVTDEEDPNSIHWEITPGLSYGITDHALFDIHAHLSSFGPAHFIDGKKRPPFIEAFATSVQIRLGEEGQLIVDPGFVISYERPFKRAKEYLGSCEVISGTIILSKSFGVHRTMVLNLNGEYEDGELSYTWGIGFKTPITVDPHGPGAGIEVKGGKESLNALFGFYIPLTESAILKTGIGIGRGDEAEDLRFHLSFFRSM